MCDNTQYLVIIPDKVLSLDLYLSALLTAVLVSMVMRNLFECDLQHSEMVMECWMVEDWEKISVGQRRKAVCQEWSSPLSPSEAGQLDLT